MFTEYKIVSVTQTNLDFTMVGDTYTRGIGDAIKAAVTGRVKFDPNMDGLSASGGFFADRLSG